MQIFELARDYQRDLEQTAHYQHTWQQTQGSVNTMGSKGIERAGRIVYARDAFLAQANTVNNTRSARFWTPDDAA